MSCSVALEVNSKRHQVVGADDVVGTPILGEEIEVFDMVSGDMYSGTISAYDEETDSYLITL